MWRCPQRDAVVRMNFLRGSSAVIPTGVVLFAASSCIEVRPRLSLKANPAFKPSRKDCFDHVAMDVGETAVHSIGAHGELFVVDAEEVQDGGVEVVAGRDVLRGLVPNLVTSPVGYAAFDPCAP